MLVPGIAPNGKPRPWLDRVWPGKSKNAVFGQKTFVFGLFLAISHYLGVPPGGASTVFFILVAPVNPHQHSTSCNPKSANFIKYLPSRTFEDRHNPEDPAELHSYREGPIVNISIMGPRNMGSRYSI